MTPFGHGGDNRPVELHNHACPASSRRAIGLTSNTNRFSNELPSSHA